MNKNKTLTLMFLPLLYVLYYNLFILFKYKQADSSAIAFPLEKLVTVIAAVVLFTALYFTREGLIRKFIGSYFLFYAIFGLYTFLVRFQVHMEYLTDPELRPMIQSEINFILLILLYPLFGGIFFRSKELIQFCGDSN